MSSIISSEIIGVFDSGLGGLTALRQVRALAPGCDVIYLGDTARVPYGTRDEETLIRFAQQDVEFLRQQGAQQVLIACGTISSVLPPEEWKNLPVPCQGVLDAAVAAALQASRSRRIGILATPATIRSDSYVNRLKAICPQAVTVPVACPDFVPLIESGQANSSAMAEAAHRVLEPVKLAKCDTVILGCTHYPLAAPVLSHELGDNVVLIDSGGEAAAALVRKMPIPPNGRTGTLRCFVSGDADTFALHARTLIGPDLLGQVEHMDW